jgi:hypothetical protein
MYKVWPVTKFSEFYNILRSLKILKIYRHSIYTFIRRVIQSTYLEVQKIN